MTRISQMLQPLDARSGLPLYQQLQRSLREAIERRVLGPDDALPERDAGLLVERLGFHKDGRAVEFAQSYYRGDIYDFVAELSDST